MDSWKGGGRAWGWLSFVWSVWEGESYHQGVFGWAQLNYPKEGFVDSASMDPGLEASEGMPGELWGQSQRFTPISSCKVDVSYISFIIYNMGTATFPF